jgi:hypothetical protein
MSSNSIDSYRQLRRSTSCFSSQNAIVIAKWPMANWPMTQLKPQATIRNLLATTSLENLPTHANWLRLTHL